MSEQDHHLKGLAITAAGVLILTPDSLLVRLIAVDVWTMVFWRGALLAAAVMGFLLLRHRSKLGAPFRAIGLAGLLAAGLYAVESITFVAALSLTTVANTLIIAATAPIFAALLSRLLLGERTPLRTWLAIAAALCGIVVTMSASFGSGGLGSLSLWGDLAALVTAVGLGGYFTLARRIRNVSMLPAIVLGAAISAAVALPFAAPLSVGEDRIGYLLVMGLAVLPLSFALITTGPRYLPAPEVSLLLLLETVLGPFWVWLVIREEPDAMAYLGGGIVLMALALHSLAALRAGTRRVAPIPEIRT